MKKVLIGGLFALALFVWLGNYFFKPLSNDNLQQPPCNTVGVKRGNVISKLSGRGVIQARRIIDVWPESSGRIEELLVKEGQRVISGTPLIKIKSGSNYQIRLHAISKELNDSNAKMTIANKNLIRQKELFAVGLVPKMKVEEAEKAVAEAMRRLNSAKAKTQIFEKETGLKVDAHLSFVDDLYSYVIAPITGTVVEINAKVGETIRLREAFYRNPPTVIIADFSQIVVEYKVSEIDVYKIKNGQAASVQLDSHPGMAFSGTVIKVSSIAVTRRDIPDNRRLNDMTYFKTKILLKKPDINVRIGMPCRVDVILKENKDVLTAPVEVVGKNEGQKFVYRVQNNVFVYQPITTGLEDENIVEIISGIDEGDLLCTNPLMLLEWEEMNRRIKQRTLVEKLFDRQ